MALPKFPLLFLLVAAAALPSLRAQTTPTPPPPSATPVPRPPTTPEADAAWAEFRGLNPLPALPPEWQKTPPKDQTLVRDTLRAETDRLLAIAEQGKAFVENFPSDWRRHAALQTASQALLSAQKLGSPTGRQLLAKLDRERLADPQLPDAARLEIRMRQVQTESEALVASDAPETRQKFEAGARALTAEFPKEAAPWAMLMEIVDLGNDPTSRAKLKEIAESQAPAPVKDRANGILRRYDSLGRTLALKFTALDGREVDLAALRGKVVVIQFWATWCDSCVESMETMAKAYVALRDLGVEIIGVNIDSDKAKVEELLKAKSVAWPQFFEPAGPANRLVRELGVTSVPSMWLVDRNGTLRDLNGQVDLTKKLEGFIGETTPPAPK